MYAIHCRVPFQKLEPWVLIPNVNYNPNFTVMRWSGLPLYRSNAITGKKAKFHAALAESIEREGVQNPVCVYEIGGKLFVTYGASRVGAVRRLFEKGRGDGLVPCIVSGPQKTHISDLMAVNGSYIDLLAGPQELTKWFKVPPKAWTIEKEGFLTFTGCKNEWDEEFNPEPNNG